MIQNNTYVKTCPYYFMQTSLEVCNFCQNQHIWQSLTAEILKLFYPHKKDNPKQK